MNSQRIVLAFNGHPASCAAVQWLLHTHGAEVVALIVDVGQGEDPEETHGRALACGARRAHVVERLDEFARRAIVPAAAADVVLDERALRQLAYPVIAAALVQVAAIEGAGAVAHGSADEAFETQIHALAPGLRVIAPARESLTQHIDAPEYVKMHHLPAGVHRDRHLLIRRGVRPSPAASGTATVAIAFESGIPVSVNGVAMALPELIESLSLIGGQYRVHGSNSTPALTLLQRAYRLSDGHGSVTMQLQPGSLEVSNAELVSHA